MDRDGGGSEGWVWWWVGMEVKVGWDVDRDGSGSGGGGGVRCGGSGDEEGLCGGCITAWLTFLQDVLLETELNGQITKHVMKQVTKPMIKSTECTMYDCMTRPIPK